MESQNLSQGTIDDYLYEMKKVPHDPEEQKTYLVMNRKKRMLISAYRKYLRFLKTEGIINSEHLYDLLDTYKLPKKRGRTKKGKWYSQDKWGEIVQAAPTRCAKLGIWIGLQFGLRLGEIINLRIQDVDLSNNRFLIQKHEDGWHPKCFRDRSIPIPPVQRKILVRWLKIRPNLDHDFLLWCGSDKHKVSERTFQRWCSIALEGLKPHDLRRSFANALYYNSGKDVKIVSDVLGHASVGTTSNYLGLDEEEIQNKFIKAMS